MRTPTYIIKNKNGIYYFRYVIPLSDAHLFPKNRREIRRTLKTRIRSEALKRARVYWVKMTDRKISNLEQEISDWQVKMRRGTTLLDEFKSFDSSYEQTYSTDTYEEFIAHLSDEDIFCLELVSKHNAQKTQDTGSPNTPNTTIPTSSLQSLFSEHLHDKGALEQKTLDGYERRFKLFIRITGATTIQDITRDAIRHYRSTLPKLPPRLEQNKAYSGKSIEQILQINHPKYIAFKTAKENFVTIRSFLTWLSTQQYIDRDFSALLGNIKNPDIKKDSEHRAAFTESDLNKLFGTQEYQLDGFKGYSFRYWIPLLALYTGARSNELSQLFVEDIYTEEGVLVIDINKNHNKKLKTTNAVRKIPVHKVLIELGFMEYLDTVKSYKQSKLFPPLKPDVHRNCARKVSAFFNASYKKHNGYLDYCGITKSSDLGEKVFHSFRHTFINQWKQQRLNNSIVKQVVGHSSNDLTLDTYGKGFSLSDTRKELNKIKFKFDKPPIKWRKTFY